MRDNVFADATPVSVAGEVERLINGTERGWLVTLINNNGVFKPQQGMAQVDRSAIVNATISLRGQGIQSASEWSADRKLDLNKQGGVTVTLAPGGIAVAEWRTH